MKKLFQLGAIFLGILVTSAIGAQDYANNDGSECCPADTKTGECYCLYCHYEPCYYCTCRCVEEKIPCKKQCCRYVPKYYDCQRCRYVPQYYCETYCRYEPEYYCVDDCKTCTKYVYDKHCKYVPKYYWKHTCDTNARQDACCPR